MKSLTHILILIVCCFKGIAQDPVDYVDPFIGTHDSRPLLFPGATMPFGMVKLSPDNQKSGWKAGHDYQIKNIAGFNFIHDYHLTGFYVMPTVGKLHTEPGPEVRPDLGYRSRISNDREEASPGYYSVFLEDYGIKAEVSATTRVGIQRYTFPRSDEATVMFDFEIPYEDPGNVLEVKIKKISNTEIEGYIKVLDTQLMGNTIWLHNDYYLYFVTRTDTPFDSLGVWQDDILSENITEYKGKGNVGCFLRYRTQKGEKINIQTALSMVSEDQARLNLDTETRSYGFQFDKYRKNARAVWNSLLGKIKVEDDNKKNKIKFYTNLYRAYSAKSTWSDVNGKWVDMNEEIAQSPNNQPIYASDAFWGMRWNLNGLWSLVNPSIMNSWVNSLLEIYKRGGWLPKGPNAGEYSAIMTSSPAVSLIASAYQQGIRNYDVDLAYEAVSKIMKEQGRIHKSGGFVGNRWLQYYTDYGYVPYEYGPASATMEMAFQDWCVAQMAKDLGKKEDYRYFIERSQNYKNQLDPATQYARMKSSSGNWISPFKPFSAEGFIEGNAWQYTFFAPHDVQGIINFLGKDLFLNRLEEGFEHSKKSKFNATGDRYGDFPINHGNQPNMQAAYLFNYAGRPWQTQHWARELMDIYYGDTPEDGWPGDEDQGQMGGWFVMSALGFFQMQGGCGTHPIMDLGSPLFKKVTIALENGKKLTIETKNNGPKNYYVQSAKLNAIPLDKAWLFLSEIQQGGRLEFIMGPNPNKTWGTTTLPPSLSKPGKWSLDNKGTLQILGQNLKDPKRKTYMDTVTVTLKQEQKDGIIKYTTDGSNPTFKSPTYRSPLKFWNTVTVKALAFDLSGKQLGALRSDRFEKLDFEQNATTGQKTSASSFSPGHDPSTAVDGFVDRDVFWDASPYPQWWMVELDKAKEVNKLALFTYWDGERAYQYTVEASMDGQHWKTLVDATQNTKIATKKGYTHSFSPIKAKWFRVNMLKNTANKGVHLSEFRIY